MTTVHSVLPSLAPLLPELILGVGVLLLILYGAWRGDRSAETVSIGALALLLAGSRPSRAPSCPIPSRR
jgi:NADH-quinone oxidoreductase subunit N